MVAVAFRLINSLALGIASFRIRKKCWALKGDGFDYRAAQDNTALIARGGPRSPRHEENHTGALGIATPSDFDQHEMPSYVDVGFMLSRAPAHLNVKFKHGRAYGEFRFAQHVTIPPRGSWPSIKTPFLRDEPAMASL